MFRPSYFFVFFGQCSLYSFEYFGEVIEAVIASLDVEATCKSSIESNLRLVRSCPFFASLTVIMCNISQSHSQAYLDPVLAGTAQVGQFRDALSPRDPIR